jgi:hypothetical protein
MPAIRGSGLPTVLGRLITNLESLAAGQTRILPAGPNAIDLGQYSVLQVYDPVRQTWRIVPRQIGSSIVFVECDGVNQRIANLSGCPVGAVVTNAGTGYTSAPTVTVSGQISTWQAIVGGLINTSQTVVSGGSGYTIPPRLVIPAPPAPGIQATGHVTISSGIVNSIVIDNQGAGYPSAPTCAFVTDPNDLGTAIVPATAQTLAITGANTVAAVINTNPGLPLTAVPTLVFSGGGGSSAAATALCAFSVTGYTVSSGGSFHAGTIIISGGGVVNTASVVPTHTNPNIEQGIILPRPTKLTPALSSGAIVASATTAPLNVEDWGFGFQLIPNAIPIDGTGLGTTVVTTLAFTVGGQTDIIGVQPLTG